MGRTYSFTVKKKLNTVGYAFEHGNRAARRHFNVNEANIQNWCKQYDKPKTLPIGINLQNPRVRD